MRPLSLTITNCGSSADEKTAGGSGEKRTSRKRSLAAEGERTKTVVMEEERVLAVMSARLLKAGFRLGTQEEKRSMKKANYFSIEDKNMLMRDHPFTSKLKKFKTVTHFENSTFFQNIFISKE